jgi:hypothetical protein
MVMVCDWSGDYHALDQLSAYLARHPAEAKRQFEALDVAPSKGYLR